MFSTKSLALKSLLPSIHEPVVIDKRTSKKILDTLVSSFSRSLDKEYGSLNNYDGDIDPRHAHRAHPRTNPEDQNVVAPRPWAPSKLSSDTKRRPHFVQSHMDALLSHPLFSYDAKTPDSRLLLLNPQQTAPTPSSSLSDSGIPRPQRDPMEVFDEAVSKGLMTPSRAAGCLLAKKNLLEKESGSPDELSAKMAALRAGTRVVRWLRSCGAERSLSFLRSNGKTMPAFVRVLVAFLVAEGRQNVVWEWYRRLVATDDNISSDGSDAGNLIIALLLSQWSTHVPYESVLEASHRLRDTTHQPFSKPASKPWLYVAYHATMDRLTLPPPTASVFDEFVGLAERFYASLPPSSSAATTNPMLPRYNFETDLAHLDLHHPTRPNPDRAVDFITRQKSRGWGEEANNNRSNQECQVPNWEYEQQQLIWKRTQRRDIRLAQMGVDATNYFVRRREAERAESIYAAMKRLLPPRIMALSPWNEGAELALAGRNYNRRTREQDNDNAHHNYELLGT